MTENLSSSERDFAQQQEAAFRRTQKHLAAVCASATNMDKVTGPAQRFVDNHSASSNPVMQGRVDAHQEVLDKFGRR